MTAFLTIAISALLLSGVYSGIYTSFTQVVGVSGIVNFAEGDFVMVGGYAAYYFDTHHGYSPLVTFPIACVAGAAIGGLVYLGILRKAVRRAKQFEHDQLILTLALSIVLENVALLLFTANTVQVNVSILSDFNIDGVFISGNAIVACLAGILVTGITIGVRYTRLGRAMAICREDPELASFVGMRVDLVNLFAFMMSTGAAALLGCFLATTTYVFPTVGQNVAVGAFAVIIIGGLGNIGGALVATVVVELAVSLVEGYLPSGGTWGYGVPFLLLALTLIIRPEGLGGSRRWAV